MINDIIIIFFVIVVLAILACRDRIKSRAARPKIWQEVVGFVTFIVPVVAMGKMVTEPIPLLLLTVALVFHVYVIWDCIRRGRSVA